MSLIIVDHATWVLMQEAIARIDTTVATIAPVVSQMQRTLAMVDANVAAVQADVATLKTNVTAIQTEIAALLAKQSAAIDAEDLAAIEAIHGDLVTVNASLSAVATPPTP
jgi:hypothetical protein